MSGIFPSRNVSVLCLFVAICALFLRGIVYHHIHQPESAETKEKNSKEAITLAYHERQPLYISGADNSLTGLEGQHAVSVFQQSGHNYTIQRMLNTITQLK